MSITPDTVTSPHSTGSSNLTFSATVNAGDSRTLVVAVSARDVSGGQLNSVEYGGVGLQRAVFLNDANGLHAALYYLTAPTVGTANVVISTSGVSWMAAVAISLFGVEQDSGSRVNDTDSHSVSAGNVISLSGLVTTVDGCAIIDACASNQPLVGMTSITNRIRRLLNDSVEQAELGDGAGCSTLITLSPAGSVNMEWDLEDGTNGCLAALALKPATEESGRALRTITPKEFDSRPAVSGLISW